MSTARLLKPNVNVRIENRLLVLEPITASRMDETYVGWLNNPEINQFLEIRYEQQTLADAEAYVNRLRGIPGCECFSVTQKKGQRPVGTTSITAFNSQGHGMAVYGIMIGDAGARMIGIGGMVHVMLLEFLFSDSRIRRIEEGAYAANEAACKAMATLGFQLEGVLREKWKLSTGEYTDDWIYGMLREEWFVSNRRKVERLLQGIQFTNLT